MKRTLLCMGCALLAALASAAEPDPSTVNRILDEGMNRSELALTAAYLTDRIGGRMTNSPQMRAAEKWTQEQFRKWGLQNVRAEGFEFGRGWSIERIEVRMVEPRIQVLRAIPVAWTPATRGSIDAPIIVAPMQRERHFTKWQGKLRDRIVLITQPDEGSEPDSAPFKRLSDEELGKLNVFDQPVHSTEALKKSLENAAFMSKLDAFLAQEGALAWVRKAYRDGGLLHGEGYSYETGKSPHLPGIELAAEDYRKLARLALTDAPLKLEVNSQVRYHDEDSKAYNILADLPGREAKAGYVMAGAHLDSWVAADGAQDNGAGSAVVMEAARILKAIGAKPKRTIRFVLWSGEEQGLLGSMAYVERYLAARPPVTEADKAGLSPYYTWNTRWPITPKPGSKDLVAYFNIDNGSGKLRGIYAEGNPAVVPIFRQWLEPFSSMGATTVAARRTGGTDHVFMQTVGIPAFQFIQDPLDYGSRIHHSSIDSYDHLKMPDLKQAAVILASFLWMSAEREQPLPRMPVPTQPDVSNPFEYPSLED